MEKGKPRFGQVTDGFPFGYGYCQCGCKQVTDCMLSGEFKMFLPNHYQHNALPNLAAPATNASTPSRYVIHDKALVDLVTTLVQKQTRHRLEAQILRSDIELVVRLVNNFIEGHEDAKRLIVEKLNNFIARLKILENDKD